MYVGPSEPNSLRQAKQASSNFYKDLEGVLDWEASDIKSENQNEPFEYLRAGMM